MKTILPFFLIFFTNQLYCQTEILKDSLDDPIAMVFNGDQVFVALHGQNPYHGKIVSFDINNPEETYEIHFDNLFYPRSLALKDNILYIGFNNYIGKFDIDSENPEIIPLVTGLNSAISLIFQGTKLFIAENDRISMIDTDSSVPQLVEIIGNFELSPLSIDIKDEFIYIATGKDILKYNIQLPNSELEDVYSAFDVEGRIYSIEIVGDKLFLDSGIHILEDDEKIWVFDLEDPTSTVTVFADNLLSVMAITYHEGHLYYAYQKPIFTEDEKEGKIIKINKDVISSTIDFQEEKIIIYPNPARDFINIELPDNYTYHIFNNIGQAFTNLQNSRIVNLSLFEDGIYYIQFFDNNKFKVLSQKFIVSK